MKYIFNILFFCFVLSGTVISAFGQLRAAPVKSVGDTITCQIAGSQYTLTPDKSLIAGLRAAPNDEEIQEVFDKVSRLTGLKTDVYTIPVIEKINLEICPGSTNYIAYNGKWVEKLLDETKNRNVLYYLIAHEIGHYVKAHDRTSLGSNPEIELQADEYSGEILAKMGICLSDAEAALKSDLMQKYKSSHTHGKIEQRLMALRTGWQRFGNQCESIITIDSPSNGDRVGLTAIFRGTATYVPNLNHYVVVISLTARRYFIQQPVTYLPNGKWEGYVAFGTINYGIGHQWSVRIFSTSSKLSVGEIFSFPADAKFSNEVIVTRVN